MILCKKKCEFCRTYFKCNGYQIINMRYCKNCKRKLGIRTYYSPVKKKKSMVRKIDSRIMKRWVV